MTLQNSTSRSPAPCERGGSVRRPTAHWYFSPGAQDPILGPDAPDWFNLRPGLDAELVKRGERREIWRVRLGDTTVYAKTYCSGPGVKGFLARFGWSQAWREYNVCLGASQRGISVIRPLGVGIVSHREAQRGSSNQPSCGSVFLSEGVEGAESLSERWVRRCAAAQTGSGIESRKRIIEAVAWLMATAHARGFLHRDAHPGNILVSEGSDQGLHVCFADVLGARLMKRPLARQYRLRSIAQLDQYFQRKASRTDRLRFLEQYDAFWEQYRPTATLPRTGSARHYVAHRRGLAALALAKEAHAHNLAQQRDRRIRRNGRYFKTLSLAQGWKATVCLRLERRHVFPEVHVVDRTEDEWRYVLEKHIADAAVSGLQDHEQVEGDLVIRFAQEKSKGNAILTWDFKREFEKNHRLRHRDVHAELVLAHAWQRRWGKIMRTISVRPSPQARCGSQSQQQSGALA